ncbi:MAG: phosphate acyltransferase [Eubacteriales bacterium]|nr:phosphate acyltransferase [Eubacteriales bacterium]
MKSIDELIAGAKEQTFGRKKVAVAAAADAEVLEAVIHGKDEGVADFTLFGDSGKIRKALQSQGAHPADYEIFDACSDEDACGDAVRLVSSHKADIIMKGMVSSSVFMKAVLNKEYGLRDGDRAISSIAIVEDKENERLLFITDPGFIPEPDLEMKKKIIQNGVEILHRLGIAEPKVAVLSSSETVNPKIQSSIDGAELMKQNVEGEITGCVVAGPISFDLAISEKAAKHKGYKSPVAGKADMLLVSTLDVGNVLYKSLAFFAHVKSAGVVAGAKAPIVFTSRADSWDTKFNTIAVATLLVR